MITVTLCNEAGERIALTVKTGWHDVTVQEYIDLQGKPESELVQAITGLTPEQLAALDSTAAHYLADLISGFAPMEETETAVDIETETVGQFETVKSLYRKFTRSNPDTATALILPYVYGYYKAEKVTGKWSNYASMVLAEKAKQMMASEVVPFALAVFGQLLATDKKYADLGREDSGTEDEAGEDEMDVFGFYPVLHLLSGGDITRHEEIMQQSVRKVYTHLHYLNELGKKQKETANG